VVVALFAAEHFGSALAAGVLGARRQVREALFAAAGVSATEIEALRVFGAVVEMLAAALVKVRGREPCFPGCEHFSAAQAEVGFLQRLFEFVVQLRLVDAFRQLKLRIN